MKRYIVSVPIAGAIHIEVEAADPKAAKKAAWKRIDNEDAETVGEIEWEFLEHITEGNGCHAPLNDIEVNEVK